MKVGMVKLSDKVIRFLCLAKPSHENWKTLGKFQINPKLKKMNTSGKHMS